MSDKKQQPNNEEKVTIGCYISLFLAIVFFSGIAAGSAYFWSFLDFTTLMGSAGKVVSKVTETPEGLKTAMSTFRGVGGSGAIDGFMLAISMVVPGVMLAMGMITVFEHYGALRAAKQLLTPVLQFLIGVPGTATLALIACLQSTDGGAALTRQLKDSGALNYREINNGTSYPENMRLYIGSSDLQSMNDRTDSETNASQIGISGKTENTDNIMPSIGVYMFRRTA